MKRIPESSFVRDLKIIASGLNVVWSETMEVWCIYYTNPNGRTYKVHEVRDDEGNYQHLDERTLALLRKWDTSKNPDAAAIIAKKQFEEFTKANLRRQLNRKAEKRYKGRQMVNLWAKVVDKLYTNGRYVKEPIARKLFINEARKNQLMTQQTGQIFNKLGMPHLTGNAKIISIPNTPKKEVVSCHR